MASVFSSSQTLFCSFIIAFVAVISTSVYAAEFEVGGPVGWRIPAANESQLYNVWASRRRFYVGDSLRFRYKNDSVVVVEKYGFYHCDTTKPVSYFNDGDTLVSLDKAGTMYFISGDDTRCKEGVKMILEVKNPGPVRHSKSNPPEGSISGLAPAPAVQVLGDSPVMSPGPSSSGSVASFAVSLFVTVSIVGLGLVF